MNLWFFDHRADSGLTKFLEGRKSELWIQLRFPPDEDGILESCIVAGDVIIAHGQDWELYAKNNPMVHVVRITVDGTGVEPTSRDPQNYHASPTPWSIIDNQLKAPRLQQLLEQIEKKEVEKINWTLLAPSPFPEYLVSAYLLQLAKQRERPGLESVALPEGFWQQALEEFKAQRTVIMLKRNLLDENLSIGDWMPDDFLIQLGIPDLPKEGLSLDKGLKEVGQLFAAIEKTAL
ncbi:MAG: hypothetical protein F9K32_13530 [Desulfobulbaceae bacterium]|nr:MAG: hypothetical protein F9K32_13530 [Desulfobulbaceae bacterium]